MVLKIYMRVTSKKYGVIAGDNSQAGREKLIACFGVKHDLELARDAQTGLPAGRALHQPVVVTTAPGAHTPGIVRACEAADPVDVEITMYRINRMGEEEEYLTLRLSDALVVASRVRFRETVLEENRACEHVEDISFAGGKAVWSHAPARITSAAVEGPRAPRTQ
jgi:type VI secretion system secreted protein Hcp